MDGTLSYTGRDIVDIRKALVDKIPELTDKWTDFNESDLGMVILELIAGAQDMQNFYFDTQAFETYLDTAEQPKNIYSILRAMNYRIPLMGAAKGEVRLEYKTPEQRLIYVPRYYPFACSKINNVRYVASKTVNTFTQDGVIDIPVMEGEYKEIRLTRKHFESNLTSSGNVSRRVYLGFSNVAEGSVEINQEGCVWTEVDDALVEYKGGYVYSLHRDSTGEVYILMSVNFMDLIPVNKAEEIVIKFVVCSGSKGVVDAFRIDTILYPTQGTIYPLELDSIGNYTKTYGAYDDVDLSTAKVLARRHAQTLGRYITLEDYENGVASEPYVKYCRVYDWKTLEYVTEPYVVKVWAVDHDGNSIGPQDKETIIQKFRSKGVTAVDVQVVDTEIIEFDIHIQMTLRTTNVNEASKVCNIVRDKILEYYSIDNLSYGSRISLSMLHSRVFTMSPYVKDVLVKSPEFDIEVSEVQFPKLRNVLVEVVTGFD